MQGSSVRFGKFFEHLTLAVQTILSNRLRNNRHRILQVYVALLFSSHISKSRQLYFAICISCTMYMVTSLTVLTLSKRVTDLRELYTL